MPPAPPLLGVGERKITARPVDDSRSRSIWRWQLVLAASVIGIALAIVLLQPAMLARWQIVTGLIAIVLITSATLAVPWRLVDTRWVIAVPLLDLLAIGALSSGSDVRLSFLWVFPISWIATYYSMTWMLASLGIVTAMLIGDAIVGTLSSTLVLRVVVIALSLAFIGITISTGSTRTRAYSRLLRRQFDQTGRTLARVAEQEARSRSVYNAIEAPLAGIALDGSLVNANLAYRALYGIDDIDQPHPASSIEYDGYRGTALPAAATSVARAASGELFTDERFWVFDVEGRWHALDITSARIQAGAREPESMLLSVKDVTAMLTAEQQNKSMASVVSHELRNPLTAIIGRTELLLDDDLPDAVRTQLLVIEDAAERMERLIGTLLRSGRGAVVEEPEAFDLGTLVEASVEAFRPAAQLSEVELAHTLTDELAVVGDAFRLRQAIDNVIGNAVKYTPRGGSVVVSGSRVTVTGERTADGTVRLVVEDTGIGIAPADLEKVFTPYFRSQAARDSAIPGTGLGMGITREIIEQQGGALEIDSTLGEGTRVTITLPARPEGTTG